MMKNECLDPDVGLGSSNSDENFIPLLVELQKQWMTELQYSREKVLVEMTEKLHQEFLSDQQKIRTELLTEFKQELDEVRANLEEQYRDTCAAEIAQLEAIHRQNLSNVKKKQWCYNCEEEAVYFCCWNTSYCSQRCQHEHWRNHRKFCRRRRSGGNREGAASTDGSRLSNSNDAQQ
uniref:MYND-type domain-containing protein n=1 Tax=Panagrolaimus sp. JU765 TaxID=591449 RepID=A0AC34QPF1_9BILA